MISAKLVDIANVFYRLRLLEVEYFLFFPFDRGMTCYSNKDEYSSFKLKMLCTNFDWC